MWSEHILNVKSNEIAEYKTTNVESRVGHDYSPGRTIFILKIDFFLLDMVPLLTGMKDKNFSIYAL